MSIGTDLKALRDDLDNEVLGQHHPDGPDAAVIERLDAIIASVWTEQDDIEVRASQVSVAIERIHSILRSAPLDYLRKEADKLGIERRAALEDDLHAAIVAVKQSEFDREIKTTFRDVRVGDKLWTSNLHEGFFTVIKRSEFPDGVMFSCDPGPNIRQFSVFGKPNDVAYVVRDIPDDVTAADLVETTLGKVVAGDVVVVGGEFAEVDGLRPRPSGRSRIDLRNHASIGGYPSDTVFRLRRAGEQV